MDFAFTEDQQGISALVRQMGKELVTEDSLRAVDEAGDGMHGKLWSALANAELLGVALPEAAGGAGLGLTELFVILEQLGRVAAPTPLVPSIVMGALPIARFGTAEQVAALADVCRGERILSAALVDSDQPAVRAERAEDGWTLHGIRDCVPAAQLASTILVPARDANGNELMLLVGARARGAAIERQVGTDDIPLGRLVLDGAFAPDAAVLGDVGAGSHIREWTLERAKLALCAFGLGLASKALHTTANYACERKQFGRAIGTFQAVAQRAGDAYVDVETMRLTLWRATWLLDQGRDASDEIAVACMFGAECGHRVVAAAQHIHGGIGFDRDYPLYRYFLMHKQLEFLLAPASAEAARLGDRIVESASIVEARGGPST